MKKFTNSILITLAAALVLSVSQFNHVAAMPDQSGMRTSNHVNSTSYSQHCELSHVGTQATNKDQDTVVKKKNIKDDEPEPPYYLHFVGSRTISSKHVIAYIPLDFSDKVPLYRLCSVVRR